MKGLKQLKEEASENGKLMLLYNTEKMYIFKKIYY